MLISFDAYAIQEYYIEIDNQKFDIVEGESRKIKLNSGNSIDVKLIRKYEKIKGKVISFMPLTDYEMKKQSTSDSNQYMFINSFGRGVLVIEMMNVSFDALESQAVKTISEKMINKHKLLGYKIVTEKKTFTTKSGLKYQVLKHNFKSDIGSVSRDIYYSNSNVGAFMIMLMSDNKASNIINKKLKDLLSTVTIL